MFSILPPHARVENQNLSTSLLVHSLGTRWRKKEELSLAVASRAPSAPPGRRMSEGSLPGLPEAPLSGALLAPRARTLSESQRAAFRRSASREGVAPGRLRRCAVPPPGSTQGSTEGTRQGRCVERASAWSLAARPLLLLPLQLLLLVLAAGLGLVLLLCLTLATAGAFLYLLWSVPPRCSGKKMLLAFPRVEGRFTFSSLAEAALPLLNRIQGV